MHCNITLARKYIGESEELRVGVAESTSRSAEVGCREKCRTEKSPHRPLQTIHTHSPQLFQPITVSTVILRGVVKKKSGYLTVRLTVSVYPPPP